MEQSRANPLVRLAAEHAHEGHALVTIEIHGEPHWLANQFGAALDYQKVDQVVTNVTGPWSDELSEGIDYTVLRNGELKALKAAAPGLVDPRAPSVMVLTETGVNLVALLSRQPKARDLRRWLASEVLPSIRHTGTYQSAPPPPRGRGRSRALPGPTTVGPWEGQLTWQEDAVGLLERGEVPVNRVMTTRDHLLGRVLRLLRTTGFREDVHQTLLDELARRSGLAVSPYQGPDHSFARIMAQGVDLVGRMNEAQLAAVLDYLAGAVRTAQLLTQAAQSMALQGGGAR
jgi:prophage antirepressor-like protein